MAAWQANNPDKVCVYCRYSVLVLIVLLVNVAAARERRRNNAVQRGKNRVYSRNYRARNKGLIQERRDSRPEEVKQAERDRKAANARKRRAEERAANPKPPRAVNPDNDGVNAERKPLRSEDPHHKELAMLDTRCRRVALTYYKDSSDQKLIDFILKCVTKTG